MPSPSTLVTEQLNFVYKNVAQLELYVWYLLRSKDSWTPITQIRPRRRSKSL